MWGAPGRRAGQTAGAMSGGDHEADTTRRRAALLVVAGVLLLVATRVCHPISGLGNADIAGIFYEADRIREGLVPYVDTIDMKPPGTFFLIAAVFEWFGRSLAAVKWFYIFWAALGGPAMWVAARALYGRVDAAAAAAALYLAWIGTFDFNYSAWMTPMYAWAFAWLMIGVRRGRWWGHLAAGTCAALALALKGQAIVLAPVFVLVWLWGRWRREVGATWGAWALWVVGAGLGVMPLVGWYAGHGAVGELIAALVPVGEAAAYAARVQPEGWWFLKIGRVVLQLARVFPLHALLASAVVVAAMWTRRRGDVPKDMSAPIAPQVVFLGMSVVGCGIGGLRFYVHYLPQYLPALALLAVHPLGLRWWAGRGRFGWVVPAAAAVVAAVLVLRIPLGYAANVDYRGSKNADVVGEYVQRRTTEDETILVWGWAAWGAYFYADRRSPSAIFKVLGQVTEYNQNGMFTRSRSANFVDGPHAQRLLADVKKAPPAFIIKTSMFFPGVKRDPMTQWSGMQKIFVRDYVLVAKFGRIRVYERKARRSASLSLKGTRLKGEEPVVEDGLDEGADEMDDAEL